MNTRVCIVSYALLLIALVPEAQNSVAAQGLYGPTRSVRYSAARPSWQNTVGPAKIQKSRKSPYRLDSGDVVAVVLDGLMGDFASAPFHFPSKENGHNVLPSVGHPLVVLPDGTLPLPELDSFSVRGLTVTEARNKIAQAYVDNEILKQKRQVWVSLMRKRTISVNVVHQTKTDAMQRVSRVTLPADQTRVLHAIVQSSPFDPKASVKVIGAGTTRARLTNGDTVVLNSPHPGYFFTGGQLNGGQYALPADRPLNALQAISATGGVQSANRIVPPTVTVVRAKGGAVQISYAQLLRNPNSVLIGRGDTVVVK